MKTSETTKEIFSALLEINKIIVNIKSEAENKFFKSNYADLPSVLDLVKPEMVKVGLFAIQEAPIIDGKVRVTTRLVHKSGEWIETDLDIFPNKNDSQGVGGAVTYGRRYAQLALLNMGQTDDDGNGARSAKKEKADKKMESIRLKTEIFGKLKGKCEQDKQSIEKYIKDETGIDLIEENYQEILNKLKEKENGAKTI